jgi:hypothetical protein
MKLRVFGTLVAAGLFASAFVTEPADAAPHNFFARFGEPGDKKPAKKDAKASKDKEKDKDKKKDEPGGPGEMKKRIGLAPKGMRWGLSLENIAKLYDKQFDDEFTPLYKKAQPGQEMQMLDAELAEKKGILRRSRIEFGRLPTGVDQGPLKGEYSYNNGESMSRVTLKNGTERYVFFFSDKLWKIYDEHKQRAGGSLGANYKEALQILTKRFGIPPVMSEPDYKAGRNFQEAQWKDAQTIIRAINREPVLAMVYVDRNVQNNIATYRKNKVEDVTALDKEVVAATKKEAPPDEKKPGDKDKKGADKKKPAKKE